ncbi:MAG: inorganic phosphate transporter [Lactobacillaceae bacterium]|jgi:PiT family inorganic phosphate transporter|nr:inorganic phosphate transporter [Lactobacillaceae bacterium]
MGYSFFFFLSSGLFLGWSLGASDASNVFGTAVGTKMIRFRTAAITASVFVIIGAVYAGSGTSKTLGELGSINALAGAFMVAFASALTIFLMVKASLPVSTSHAIVGGIIGWNIYSGKPTDVAVFSKIVSTWILCPILAGIIAVILYLIIKLVLRKSKIHLIALDYYTRTGLILAGAFGAYALGANNIANVMGVFVDSSPLHGFNWKNIIELNSTQVLFLIGGISIALGIITYSQKVIKTVGNDLMAMSPIIALIVVIAQALVLFIFSSTDLRDFLVSLSLPEIPLVPVSSTQAVIGAIMGIGIAKGGKGIKWSVVGRIAIGWVLTPTFAALSCFILLFFLENVFNQVVFLP